MMASPFAPFETGPSFVALSKLIDSDHPPLALVGSGASVNSGYPNWPDLMAELRKMAGPEAQIPQRQEALKGDAAWEAEVHLQAIGPRRFASFIKRRFRGPRVLAEPYPTIAAMPFRHFLTTNYDPCIELALRKRKERPVPVHWEESEDLAEFLINLSRRTPSRNIVHLHGHFTRPEHAILTETAYVERYIKSDDARRKLLAIFMTQPVVFIGFSMSDPDFGNLMREVTARLRTKSPCHYALMSYGTEPEREVYRQRMRGKFGVEPIFYSLAKAMGDQHTNLLKLLKALAPMRSDARRMKVPPREAATATKPQPRDPNDPEKGQWGGSPVANGRRLKVVQRKGGLANRYLAFDLVVEPLRGARPLEGDVEFHLHPTIRSSAHVVQAKKGRAVLEKCEAYGAFTVGVSADKGKTHLELDLAMEKSLPDWFRRR